MKTYAAELKRRREMARLTTRGLGDRIDRSATFVTDFELAKKSNPPEPEMMARLAEALDWPVIEQLEAWGYPVEREAPPAANPFPRTDPRSKVVELLASGSVTDAQADYLAEILEVTIRSFPATTGDR